MPRFQIDRTDYTLSQSFGSQILAGSAFAFIDPSAEQDNDLLEGLENFYGLPPSLPRRIVPLLPGAQAFPGFKIKAAKLPFAVQPVLLTDKEIYRAGQDAVRLLVVAPAWLFSTWQSGKPGSARLVIENNGVVLRSQTIQLNEGGLTLAELGKLPQGRYEVSWMPEAGGEPTTSEATPLEMKPARCSFNCVEYVLAPLQATLQGYELNENKLRFRLKVERYNEPLTEPVQLELWSGSVRVDTQKAKPELPGIFSGQFKIKSKSKDRLEIRVSYQDALATTVIPNSTRAERQESVFSALGQEIKVSLMPGPDTREVRGLYLSASGPTLNTPVRLADPAPESREARLTWLADASAARLLLLDMGGKVVENRDLGAVKAGTELTVTVPAPGGFLALGAWLGDKAWEGWSSLLAPATVGQVSLQAPAQARPGQTVEIKISADSQAAVYLLARDSRLAGAAPHDKLASNLKSGFEAAGKWGGLGFLSKLLSDHEDWGGSAPYPQVMYRTMAFASPPPMQSMIPMPAPGAPLAGGGPRMEMARSAGSFGGAREGVMYKGGGMAPAQAEEEATVREDFADVAFCAVIQTGADGRVVAQFKLPEAITSYKLEAFALSREGREWGHTSESLEVNQPLWAEFKLPAYVYPGDIAPAALEISCNSGTFALRLLCDGQPVAYTLSGANQTGPDAFEGQRAKLIFEARPGTWRAELRDLANGEQDVTERKVEALGHFTSLSRQFQILLPGQQLDREAIGALQLRILPSLDKPFQFLCDATADYSHRCCEQTAAKLLASVAALLTAPLDGRVKYYEVIKAGVEREKKMFIKGRGFMMYPPEESGGNREPNDYWGKKAARHLGDLSIVGPSLQNAGLDAEIGNLLREAQQMGEDALRAYHMPSVPVKVESGREAFQVVIKQTSQAAQGLSYARSSLANQGAAFGKGRVLAREEKAYCAAALLSGGAQADLLTAIKAANDLAKELDSEGRLYSTVDSVAMICLLLSLRSAGIGLGGSGRLRVDGRELDLAEALEAGAAGEVHQVEVLSGTALVEVTSELVEDWNSFRGELPVSVELLQRSRFGRSLRLGDTLDLVVKVKEYIPGLLVHVCLPPSLSSIEGGGEVKKFSLDFKGRKELHLPLRATGHTLPKGEHWAVLVRNMFNEEQAGTPGLLLAQVSGD